MGIAGRSRQRLSGLRYRCAGKDGAIYRSAIPRCRDHAAPQIQLEEIPPHVVGGAPLRVDPAISASLIPLRHTGTMLAMNTTLMVWFLLAAGTLYLIIRDQRYRCRVCLRRLRMPVETGSRGFMLQLGRPRTEYICLYGHGTLKEERIRRRRCWMGRFGPRTRMISGRNWSRRARKTRNGSRRGNRGGFGASPAPRSVTRANRFSSSGVRRQGR